MTRCLQLARLGEGFTAPNPMVGSVLVHNNQIIGEGYHQEYGKAHAEINCLNSVAENNRHLIAQSTLYVSLEPCAHWGKTPPCALAIIDHKIKKVVIGCRDSYAEVDGKGIQLLKNAGIEVMVGVLELACRALNKHFFIFNEQKKPFITLKWAQTADGFIGNNHTNERLMISGDISQRWVHSLRNQYQAILIGAHTAKGDLPSLTNRFWWGNQPIKILIDPQLSAQNWIDSMTKNDSLVVFNRIKEVKETNIHFVKVFDNQAYTSAIVEYCYKNKIQSLLVEGGSNTLQQFINQRFWNEAFLLTNQLLQVKNGVKAPVLQNAFLQTNKQIGTDSLSHYIHLTD